MILTYEDVKGEVVYFAPEPPYELWEVVGYDQDLDFLKLRSLVNSRIISDIHPHQVKLWHLMGEEGDD